MGEGVAVALIAEADAPAQRIVDRLKQVGASYVAGAYGQLVVGGALDDVGIAAASNVDEGNVGIGDAVVGVDPRVDDQVAHVVAQRPDANREVETAAKALAVVQRYLLPGRGRH